MTTLVSLRPEDVVNEFSKVLAADRGSMFVGSGLSTPSGVPSWSDLLRGMARTRLSLDLRPDDDLPLVAQHIVNQAGTRGPLISYFRNQIDKPYLPNAYHEALARTNIRRFWTTNYDTILENTFRRHFNVRVRATDESISRVGISSEIEVIKMHGCIAVSEGKDLVVTQEDYENFFENRPATVHRLKQDLLDRQFLFVGYSYGDVNIRNIVVEARRLGKKSLGQHYIVVRRQKNDSSSETSANQARQDLWLADLSRLGIAACQIEDYSELTTILESIALRSRGNTVFVTGSHQREDQDELADPRVLGTLLAQKGDLVLLDGQSSGTGRLVTTAYMEECLRRCVDIVDRLHLFSNPYAANPRFSDDPNLLPTLQEWRAPLMRFAQVVVVYNGGIGTRAEVQVAKNLGCQIIPVPEASSDLPSELLKEKTIRDRLAQVDPDYLEKADQQSVSAQDVADCVQKMLDK